MDFKLTDEQEQWRAEARVFADTVVAPGSLDRDLAHTFPEEQLLAAARLGYLGLLVPKKYGGLDIGNLGQNLILEEIARADASTHVTISVHNSLVTGPIKFWGSEALKDLYLPRLATGEIIGAYALTEPHSGSDAAALSCTAVPSGDGWVLNGTKMWITTGARADLIIVFARTDKDAPKAKGISAFVVDGNHPGVTHGKAENKLGIRASETVQLFLEDVPVASDHLLGEENRGFNYALATLNGGRVGIATQAVGIAQAAFEATLTWLAGRETPKGSSFATQDVDFRVAEMATRIDAARLLTWRAADLRDRGDDHVREASMAKLFASETANQVCREAVEIMGARGWRAAGHVERFLRDARVTELYEGTTEIQKLVIARSLRTELDA
jgi:alkylation response protein AidB-like acyl-CoA dehydrogenase